MKKYLIVIILFAIYSCGNKLLISPKEISPVTTTNPNNGKDLYINKCSECHRLYAPKLYNEQEWEENLNSMQERANITDEEKLLIYNYLINETK